MIAMIEDGPNVRRVICPLPMNFQPDFDPMIRPESPALIEGGPDLLEGLLDWNTLLPPGGRSGEP